MEGGEHSILASMLFRECTSKGYGSDDNQDMIVY